MVPHSHHVRGELLSMEKNPLDVFVEECPELAKQFNNLVDVQRTSTALDPKTKHLINIAIQTATRNARGVRMHAMMAYKSGATREEIVGAVVMNLHLTGLVTVLEALPAAIAGIEEAEKK